MMHEFFRLVAKLLIWGEGEWEGGGKGINISQTYFTFIYKTKKQPTEPLEALL